jgi:hypothetical protein
MINLKYNNNFQPFQAQVNKHKNMLIIAEGATNYKLNEIAYFDSKEVVEKQYGISKLSSAFNTAKRFGVQHIFVVNVRRQSDFIEIVDVLKQYDFAYIVPIGIKFSDTFYNQLLNRQMTYAEFYLDSLGDYSRSTIIMTDSHASLYEDIDHYLDDMTDKIEIFKNVAFKALKNGRNLCMVANNLEKYEYANLVLASALCITDYNKYPDYDFEKAVFDIDELDLHSEELIYFKNNKLVNTSIENLKNFRVESDAVKIVAIDAVIKYIERELDFSEYKGVLYSEFVRLKIYKMLGEFFRKITGVVIRDYAVESVDFRITQPGTGILINSFSILPINSTEKYDIMMEV